MYVDCVDREPESAPRQVRCRRRDGGLRGRHPARARSDGSAPLRGATDTARQREGSGDPHRSIASLAEERNPVRDRQLRIGNTGRLINSAIAQINQTELKVRPRAASDNDFVIFHDSGSGSGCSSFLGRIGGSQQIEVADCGQGSVMHEVLHAGGFYHEQSRGDRDEFITIVFDEIAPEFRDEFEKR